MRIEDKEIWGSALQVERVHGEFAPRFIAERIGELALAGDFEGVNTWKAIAGRLDALRQGSLLT